MMPMPRAGGEPSSPQSISGDVGGGAEVSSNECSFRNGHQVPTVDCMAFSSSSRCRDACGLTPNSDVRILTFETLWKH